MVTTHLALFFFDGASALGSEPPTPEPTPDPSTGGGAFGGIPAPSYRTYRELRQRVEEDREEEAEEQAEEPETVVADALQDIDFAALLRLLQIEQDTLASLASAEALLAMIEQREAVRLARNRAAALLLLMGA